MRNVNSPVALDPDPPQAVLDAEQAGILDAKAGRKASARFTGQAGRAYRYAYAETAIRRVKEALAKTMGGNHGFA